MAANANHFEFRKTAVTSYYLINVHQIQCTCYDLDVEYVCDIENDGATSSNMAATACFKFESITAIRTFPLPFIHSFI